MRSVLKFLAAAVLLASALPVLAAGRFVYVEGTVSVRDAAGATREARAGEPVNEKETVSVVSGRAQIRFDDGGWITLQQNTVFEVQNYPKGAEGGIVLSLVKGGLRAVTGLIARQPQRYELHTPTATIGIRGTSFQVTYCQQSCDLPDGLYVTGGDGTIFVKNGFGEIDLTQGRTAYVANAQTPPRESNVKPVSAISEPVSARQMAQAGSTNPAELRPGNYIYFESAAGYAGPFTVMVVSSGGVAAAASGSVSSQLAGVINDNQAVSGSIIGAGAGAAGDGVIPTGSMVITLDSSQRPVNITGVSPSTGQSVSVTSLQTPQLTFSDGILYWGRWTGGKFQIDATDPKGTTTGAGTLGSDSSLHYVFGTPVASVPMAGTASYGFIGSTGSTSVAGVVGSGVTGGTLTANFATNQVSTALSINHGGVYNANGVAHLQAGNRATFTGVSGTASGPTGTHGFSFDGFFAGAPAPVAPARAGIGWTIKAPDAIVGGAAFSCKTGC